MFLTTFLVLLNTKEALCWTFPVISGRNLVKVCTVCSALSPLEVQDGNEYICFMEFVLSIFAKVFWINTINFLVTYIIGRGHC